MNTTTSTTRKWQVINTASSPMPSQKKIIEEFDTLKDAHDLSITDNHYRVRLKPEQRQKKKDENE